MPVCSLPNAAQTIRDGSGFPPGECYFAGTKGGAATAAAGQAQVPKSKTPAAPAGKPAKKKASSRR
jgi:hypothetical protein